MRSSKAGYLLEEIAEGEKEESWCEISEAGTFSCYKAVDTLDLKWRLKLGEIVVQVFNGKDPLDGKKRFGFGLSKEETETRFLYVNAPYILVEWVEVMKNYCEAVKGDKISISREEIPIELIAGKLGRTGYVDIKFTSAKDFTEWWCAIEGRHFCWYGDALAYERSGSFILQSGVAELLKPEKDEEQDEDEGSYEVTLVKKGEEGDGETHTTLTLRFITPEIRDEWIKDLEAKLKSGKSNRTGQLCSIMELIKDVKEGNGDNKLFQKDRVSMITEIDFPDAAGVFGYNKKITMKDVHIQGYLYVYQRYANKETHPVLCWCILDRKFQFHIFQDLFFHSKPFFSFNLASCIVRDTQKLQGCFFSFILEFNEEVYVFHSNEKHKYNKWMRFLRLSPAEIFVKKEKKLFEFTTSTVSLPRIQRNIPIRLWGRCRLQNYCEFEALDKKKQFWLMMMGDRLYWTDELVNELYIGKIFIKDYTFSPADAMGLTMTNEKKPDESFVVRFDSADARDKWLAALKDFDTTEIDEEDDNWYSEDVFGVSEGDPSDAEFEIELATELKENSDLKEIPYLDDGEDELDSLHEKAKNEEESSEKESRSESVYSSSDLDSGSYSEEGSYSDEESGSDYISDSDSEEGSDYSSSSDIQVIEHDEVESSSGEEK